jgi:membrane protease subunit (stomatin/prohibitin family)
MKFIRKQFLDILEWEDRGQEILVYKYPMEDNEIQNGGKLVVRPGQGAIFVNEGKIADVFLEPGTYTLSTQTLPVLTNLKNWSFGFKSPFKSDVYFVSTRRFLDQKWGTPQPVLIPDPKFEQVEIKAFGTFSFRVMDPALLLVDITSTNKVYSVEDIQGQLRSYIINNFAPIVAAQGVTVAQLIQNYQVIDAAVLQAVNGNFQRLGLEIVSFTTQNISLQQELQEAMRKRSSVNIMGNLDNYTQVQMVDAMKKSVENPGVNAMNQAGIGMGIGMGMGAAMAQGLQKGAPGQQQQPQQAPPPAPPMQGGLSCAQCGTAAAPEAAFCSKCGTKIEAAPAGGQFCTKCGAQNAGDAAFCAKCGHKMP